MKILVNGASHETGNGVTIRDLLAELGYDPAGVAVACDMEFVPRSAYGDMVVREDQEIEIVKPQQGG